MRKSIAVGKKALIVTLFSLLTATVSPILIMQEAEAGGKSPYESGYDHGCDDADISDPDERYINQPEKGPGCHFPLNHKM